LTNSYDEQSNNNFLSKYFNMNNDPYGKLTLIMNKAAMTFKRVAAASNKTTTTSNGAATPTKSGVERSTTGMWLCGGSRVPNQR